MRLSRAALITGAALAVYLRSVRPWQLRWGATDEEVLRPMPGDEVVESPTFDATRAVTVDASPEQIWPWIAQIGFGRAGWYSYDRVDNFGRRSAERIIPELQQLEVGTFIPIGPGEGSGLWVKALEPNRWVLWGDKQGNTTWYWGLYPTDDGQTRLITRVRLHYNWTSPWILFNLLLDVGDIVMMRKCMLGIKMRAEAMAGTGREASPDTRGISIYRSFRGQAEMMSIYDQAMRRIGLDFEHRIVDTRFGATHLLVAGPPDARPLVILHGGNSVNPLSLDWFAPLLKKYRVYAPDTIGHPGRSAQTRLSGRDDSYGRWMVDVLDGLGLGQVPVIGPSFGAGILLRTAIHAPHRISRAVLLVPSGIVSPPILPMALKIVLPMLLYRMFPSPSRLLRAALPLFTEGEVPDELWLRSIKGAFDHVRIEAEMPRPVSREELAGFKAPTLLVASEKDVLFPGRAVIARARQVIPNLEAELLQGYGHVIPRRAMPTINDRIVRFLEDSR